MADWEGLKFTFREDFRKLEYSTKELSRILQELRGTARVSGFVDESSFFELANDLKEDTQTILSNIENTFIVHSLKRVQKMPFVA